MSFLTTTRSNPCPCCGDTSAKCRSKLTSFSLPDNSTIEDSQIFCMAFREDTDTHKFTGYTSDRLWGKFITHDLGATLSHAWGRGNNRNTYRTGKPPIIKRPPTPKNVIFLISFQFAIAIFKFSSFSLSCLLLPIIAKD